MSGTGWNARVGSTPTGKRPFPMNNQSQQHPLGGSSNGGSQSDADDGTAGEEVRPTTTIASNGESPGLQATRLQPFRMDNYTSWNEQGPASGQHGASNTTSAGSSSRSSASEESVFDSPLASPVRRSGGYQALLQEDERNEEDEGDQLDRELDAMQEEYGDEDAVATRRKRRRKVYGGGRVSSRHASSSGSGSLRNSRSLPETSFFLFSSTISPGLVLLIPYAFSLTGLSFGIPLLIILNLLGNSFSHTVLVIASRYVGTTNYPGLAAAIFPAKYGLSLLGRVIIDAGLFFLGAGRSLVALWLTSDLASDLALVLFPRAELLHRRNLMALAIAVLSLIPSTVLTFISPRKRRSGLLGLASRIALLAPLSTLLYPVILLIIGVSLKNLSDYPSLLKPHHGNPFHLSKPHYSSQPLHTPTLWSGVSILLLVSCNPLQTFSHYRSLGRASTSSTSDGSSEQSLPPVGPPPTSSLASRVSLHFSRHRWESSTLISSFLCILVYIGFGTVGYMSLLKIGPNLFSTLPRDHLWFNIARALSLFAILASLGINIGDAVSSGRRLLSTPRRAWTSYNRRNGPPPSRGDRRKRKPSVSGFELEEDDSEVSEEEEDDIERHRSDPRASSIRSGAAIWEARLSLLATWTLVGLLAFLIHDLGGIAEVLGSIGASLMGYILPCKHHRQFSQSSVWTMHSDVLCRRESLSSPVHSPLSSPYSAFYLSHDFLLTSIDDRHPSPSEGKAVAEEANGQETLDRHHLFRCSITGGYRGRWKGYMGIVGQLV